MPPTTPLGKVGRLALIAALGIIAINMMLCMTSCTAVHVRPTPATKQVMVTKDAYNQLDFLYFAIAERAGMEGGFCMQGFVDSTTENVLITGVVPIWVDSADGMNIVGKWRCSEKNIGMIHFHPPGTVCNLSDGDIIAAHFQHWPTEAIYCKLEGDSLPSVVLMRRKEIDSTYKAMPQGGTDGTIGRTFVATYRNRRPP